MNKKQENLEILLSCPECKKKFKESDENKAFKPFCSKRCKMIDLGKWLQEKYVCHENVADADGISQGEEDNEDS